MVQIDWTPIVWIGGIFLSIISGLLIWIGILIRSERDGIVIRVTRNEETILEQQKEIKEIAASTHETVELVKQNQTHLNERLHLFEKAFFEIKKDQYGKTE